MMQSLCAVMFRFNVDDACCARVRRTSSSNPDSRHGDSEAQTAEGDGHTIRSACHRKRLLRVGPHLGTNILSPK